MFLNLVKDMSIMNCARFATSTYEEDKLTISAWVLIRGSSILADTVLKMLLRSGRRMNGARSGIKVKIYLFTSSGMSDASA